MPRRSAFSKPARTRLPGSLPTILKLNKPNGMSRLEKNATQPGGHGKYQGAAPARLRGDRFTIYPGSDAAYDQMRNIARDGLRREINTASR